MVAFLRLSGHRYFNRTLGARLRFSVGVPISSDRIGQEPIGFAKQALSFGSGQCRFLIREQMYLASLSARES